jgi:hypothetical protein
VSTNYSAMTDTEFKAHWDAQYAQLARVNRRTWLYALPLAACGIAVLQCALFLTGTSAWPFLWVFLFIGMLAAKAGRALAWRSEGGRPGYLRQQKFHP